MHVPPPQARENETPGIAVGPLSVPEPVLQFTANRQKFKAVLVIVSRKLREPVGGNVEPSRSAGSKLCAAVVLAQACLADAPISILSRSKAQTWPPLKLRPFLNMLYVM